MNEEVIIYTIREVAALLHTSPNLVYKLIEKGLLSSIRIGSLKVLKSSLIDFLNKYNGKDLSDLDNIVPILEILNDE